MDTVMGIMRLKKEIERDSGLNLASDYIQLDIIILLKDL